MNREKLYTEYKILESRYLQQGGSVKGMVKQLFGSQEELSWKALREVKQEMEGELRR